MTEEETARTRCLSGFVRRKIWIWGSLKSVLGFRFRFALLICFRFRFGFRFAPISLGFYSSLKKWGRSGEGEEKRRDEDASGEWGVDGSDFGFRFQFSFRFASISLGLCWRFEELREEMKMREGEDEVELEKRKIKIK